MTTPSNQYELTDDTLQRLTDLIKVLEKEKTLMRHTLTEQVMAAVANYYYHESPTNLAILRSAYDRYVEFNRSLLIGLLIVLVAVTGSTSAAIYEYDDVRLHHLTIEDFTIEIDGPRPRVETRNTNPNPMPGSVQIRESKSFTVRATAVPDPDWLAASPYRSMGQITAFFEFPDRSTSSGQLSLTALGNTTTHTWPIGEYYRVDGDVRQQFWTWPPFDVAAATLWREPVEFAITRETAGGYTPWLYFGASVVEIPEPSAVLLALMAALAAWRFAR